MKKHAIHIIIFAGARPYTDNGKRAQLRNQLTVEALEITVYR